MDLNAEIAEARGDALPRAGGMRTGRQMVMLGNLAALLASLLMWLVLALGGGGAVDDPAPAAAPAAAVTATSHSALR